MNENELSKIALDVAFKIHKELGPGLFESVYEVIMAYEMTNEYNLNVHRQRPIPVIWKDVKIRAWIQIGFNNRREINC